MPPKDDLLSAIFDSIPALPEKSVLAVTSKVVSIWQGRCVSASSVVDKDELIKKEADRYLPRGFASNRLVMHTEKNGFFIPTAGIDESNADGYYILWPEHPGRLAEEIRAACMKHYGVSALGVVVTDSHSVPRRRGTVGVSLGHAGFAPLHDYRETPDLFGRILKITMLNVADSIASAAVLAMGEGTERTPLALLSGVPFVDFEHGESDKKYGSFEVPKDEDLYAPFFESAPWEEGEGGLRI